MSVIIVNTVKIVHYSIKVYKGLVTANQVVSENLWMMSHEGIENAEVPYTLKGSTMDGVIINLIAEDKFNEAGKYYMEETGLDADSSYDYIYKLFDNVK